MKKGLYLVRHKYERNLDSYLCRAVRCNLISRTVKISKIVKRWCNNEQLEARDFEAVIFPLGSVVIYKLKVKDGAKNEAERDVPPDKRSSGGS